MNIKKQLIGIEYLMNSYSNNLLRIGMLLKDYEAEDKTYLLLEFENLNKKIKKIKYFLKFSRKSSEGEEIKVEEWYISYFEKFQLEFQDFLILLRWNNFGALLKKLQIVKEFEKITQTLPSNFFQGLLRTDKLQGI